MNEATPKRREAMNAAVTHEQARYALAAYHNTVTRNGKKPQFGMCIPPDPNDCDVVLADYIEQQRMKDAEIERLKAMNTRMSAAIQRGFLLGIIKPHRGFHCSAECLATCEECKAIRELTDALAIDIKIGGEQGDTK